MFYPVLLRRLGLRSLRRVPPTSLYYDESSPKLPLTELRRRLVLSHSDLNCASRAVRLSVSWASRAAIWASMVVAAVISVVKVAAVSVPKAGTGAIWFQPVSTS